MQPLLATLSLPLAGLLGTPGTLPPNLEARAEVPREAPGSPDALLRAVPSDPMVFVGVWDVDGLRKRGEKSAWYRFYQDGQVQALVEAVHGMVEQAMADDPDAPELPFELGELMDAIHGSIAGFVDVNAAEEEVVAGLLLDPGAHREQLEGVFDAVLGMVDAELETSTETYGGADLTRMDAPDGDGHIIFIDHEGLLGAVLSNESETGVEAVHGIVDRYSGKDSSDGFSGSSSLSAARASTGRGGDFELMFDFSSLVDAILAEEEPDEWTLGLLKDIGVTELRWLYFSSKLGTGESFESTVSGYVPPHSYISDFFGLIGPAPLDMLKKMPAGAQQISVSRFDVHGLFKLVMEGIRSHDEEVFAQVNGMVQMMGAMNGVDLEKDVLSQITGDIGSFMMSSTEKAASIDTMMLGVAPGGALMVGLEDPEEFELFVDDMLTNFQIDKMIESEDFQGSEIRKFNMGGGPSAFFTFTDSGFLYAADREPLQAVLRLAGDDSQPTAYDDPELKRLASTGTLSLSKMDTAGMVAMYLDLLSGVGEMLGMYGIDAEENPLTYLPWPDSAIASKYFKGDIFSKMERTGNTFRVRTWSE